MNAPTDATRQVVATADRKTMRTGVRGSMVSILSGAGPGVAARIRSRNGAWGTHGPPAETLSVAYGTITSCPPWTTFLRTAAPSCCGVGPTRAKATSSNWLPTPYPALADRHSLPPGPSGATLDVPGSDGRYHLTRASQLLCGDAPDPGGWTHRQRCSWLEDAAGPQE